MHERGCFNQYLYEAGDFVTTLARTMQLADPDNIERLRVAYPQMVAAHDCQSWNTVPDGFEPVYNARGEQKIQRWKFSCLHTLNHQCVGSHITEPDGEWVKWKDIAPLTEEINGKSLRLL